MPYFIENIMLTRLSDAALKSNSYTQMVSALVMWM